MADTTGAGDIQLERLVLVAGIIPSTAGDGALVLPALTLDGNAGGLTLPALTLDGAGLSGTVTAPPILAGEMILPSLMLAATALSVSAGHGDITLPALTLTANDGNRGAIRLPRLIVAATAFTGSVGNGRVTLPPVTLAATGYTSSSGDAALTFPRLTLHAAAIVGTTGALRAQRLRLTLRAEGLSGSVGHAALTLPHLRLVADAASGYTDTSGAAVVIELPMLYLNASGRQPPPPWPAGAVSALVLETESTRLSTYSNFLFNSLTEFNGVFLGANSDGIYALTGDTDQDATIQATIRPGVSDFRDVHMKRLTDAYVGYRASGEMTLTVTTDEDNQYDYTLTPWKSVGLHPSRIKLGKGAKGRYFQLTLQNRDGADFELDQLSMDADVLSRRLA